MTQADDWADRATLVEVGGEAVAVVDIPASGPEDGPPLLVLHGFPTSSVDFLPVTAGLSQRRRVVLLDLPGYGLSAKPDRAYSLFDQADVVAAVASQAGLDEVDLLTHDMGDSVGGELLARSLEGAWPVHVRRRVVTNGSIYIDRAQLTDGQKFLLELPDELLPAGAAPDVDVLTETLSSLCAPQLRTAEVEGRLRLGAELVVRAGGNRLLPRLIRYIGQRREHEHRWTGAIENHPAPLTVVWGRHDPIAVAAMAEQLVARRSDATLAWLEAGHWPMVEEPETFAAAVQAGLGT